MCYTHRRLFATLALHLIAEGHKDLAKKALAKAAKEIPTYNVPMNYMSGGSDLAKAYALIGDKANARKCINAVYENAKEYVEYYLSLQGIRFQQSANDIMVQFSIMNQTAEVSKLIDAKLAAKQAAEMQRFYQRYIGQGGQVQQPGQ
jgi:tetratricopeptide (TPR) repeat protein